MPQSVVLQLVLNLISSTHFLGFRNAGIGIEPDFFHTFSDVLEVVDSVVPKSVLNLIRSTHLRPFQKCRNQWCRKWYLNRFVPHIIRCSRIAVISCAEISIERDLFNTFDISMILLKKNE